MLESVLSCSNALKSGRTTQSPDSNLAAIRPPASAIHVRVGLGMNANLVCGVEAIMLHPLALFPLHSIWRDMHGKSNFEDRHETDQRDFSMEELSFRPL